MTMHNATLNAPSMAVGIPATPTPPTPVPLSGIYAAVSPLIQIMIGIVKTDVLILIGKTYDRARPNMPPTNVPYDTFDTITGYVEGPRPRTDDNGVRSVSEICMVAAYDTVDLLPDIDQMVEFQGDRYTVESISRYPESGPGIAWEITAVRG